jgi:predicted nucleotidyltransferase
MKSFNEVLETLSKHKIELMKKYRIKEMKIFGSYAEEKQEESSDIDIIVEFEENPTFIEFVKIQNELEEILNVTVDLLTEDSISPFIKPYIKKVISI